MPCPLLPGSDVTDLEYTETLVKCWFSIVPFANRMMLESAVETIDRSAAIAVFEHSENNRSGTGRPEDEQYGMADPGSDSGKRQLLLACHCYAEHSSHHGHSQSVPVLQDWTTEMQWNMTFHDTHLTPSDCHAVSKVLQQHQIMKIVGCSQIVPWVMQAWLSCFLVSKLVDSLIFSLLGRIISHQPTCQTLQKLYVPINNILQRSGYP